MDRRRAGFTLIELLVVTGIIAILAAVAVPSFTSFISNYRATTAINEFLQGVTLTRIEALKRGRKVLMVPNDKTGAPSFTGNWLNGWTIYVDLNNNQTYQAGSDDLVFQHSPLPSSITAVAATGTATAFTDGTSRTYVQFDGTGYPRQLGGTALTGGIVISDTAGPTPSSGRPVKTLCLGTIGRARIVTGLDSNGCMSG